jgi:hypothetical protein
MTTVSRDDNRTRDITGKMDSAGNVSVLFINTFCSEQTSRRRAAVMECWHNGGRRAGGNCRASACPVRMGEESNVFSLVASDGLSFAGNQMTHVKCVRQAEH